MTSPRFALHRHRNAKECTQIGDRAVELPEVYVERLALRTPRLRVQADALYVEFFKNRLIQQFLRVFDIFRPDAKLHATDEVRDKPVKSHQIIVAKKALDTRRLQASLGEKASGKSRNCRMVTSVCRSIRSMGFGFVDWQVEVALVELVFQGSHAASVRRLGIRGKALQLAVRHTRIRSRQSRTLFGFVENRHRTLE